MILFIYYSLFVILLLFIFGNYIFQSKQFNFPLINRNKQINILIFLFLLNMLIYLFILNYIYIFESFYIQISFIILLFFIIYYYLNKSFLTQYGYEYIIIFLTNLLCFVLLINTNEIISFYFILEIQSICFYILVSITLFNKISLNSGFKYLIVSSISSILLLIGFSIIYSIIGQTNFEDIQFFLLYVIKNINDNSIFFYYLLLISGFLFILISFLIKLYVAPFHFWIVDIYENTALYLISFFSSISFFTMFSVFIIWYINFFSYILIIYYIIFIFSILSMIYGTLFGLFEYNLKRIFAYSSIVNVGYALILILENEIDNALEYMFIYGLILLFGIYLIDTILNIFNNNDISVIFTGLYKRNKVYGLSIIGFFFLSSATPPSILAILKLMLVMTLNDFFLLLTNIIILLLSFLSIYFYLNLIKIVIFNKPHKYIILKDISILSYINIYLIFLLNIFFSFIELFYSIELLI
jgi:NADH-quinone oxidoreductase subunit N